MMAENTDINWADHTLNLWIGCTAVSKGCDNCYAESTWDKRRHVAKWGNHPRHRTAITTRNQCHKYQRGAKAFYAKHGRRQRVFVNSLSDFFDNKAPQEWRDEFWQDVKSCPDVDFLLLTKRPQNIKKMLPADWGDGYHNIWMGVTVENQEEAERRIPILLDVKAVIRFLSCEPLLGRVDLTSLCTGDYFINCLAGFKYHDEGPAKKDCPRIDWVIVGGESGKNARPTHLMWFRSLRNQCLGTCTTFLFKQWGEWAETEIKTARFLARDIRRGTVQSVRDVGEYDGHFRMGDALMRRVTTKKSGRKLDGITHDGFPTVPEHILAEGA